MMEKIALLLSILLPLLNASGMTHQDQNWSWDGKSEDVNSPETLKFDSSDALSAGSGLDQISIPDTTYYEQPKDNSYNETVIEGLVTDILNSKRQGRALNGFDEINPDDSSLQDALDDGNDVEARSIIRNRLCFMGLVKCNNDVEGKSSYISPEDLVYAQPVHIKPVGHPIPSIPIRNPHKMGYGPPRPLYNSPAPGKYGFATPPRRDYKPFHKPGYFGSSSPLYTSPNPIYGRPIHDYDYVTKPIRPAYISPDSPYEFEGQKDKKKVEVFVNAHGGSAVTTGSTTGLQQHVHHHFHHDADKNGLDKPLTSGFSGVNVGSYGGQNIAGYGNNFGSVKPVVDSYGEPAPFGSAVDHYGDSGFYKKEYNVDGGSNNLVSGGGFRGESSYRSENYECVCVPQQQCPAQHVLGRKDDLYLDIDPRSLKSDIDAQPLPGRDFSSDNDTLTFNATASIEVSKRISKREVTEEETQEEGNEESAEPTARQAYYGNNGPLGKPGRQCGPRHVCCKKSFNSLGPNPGINNQFRQCGTRHSQGINGRVKNPTYIDGDSEFGEYPWQVAILKRDSKESVYICGGTLIDNLHILTAAHCIKSYKSFDLRVRVGEWDVNHDVEFYPYIEKDISHVEVHPEFYAGTLYNDIALLRMDSPVDWSKSPHISPACLPYPRDDYSGHRCWTTGWGKDAFGQNGKYQNILKEVDIPVIGNQQCQNALKQTRLGYDFQLHPGFVCAGGEEGKDACKGDGGGPMVCEKGGTWQLVGIVSWGIGCGERGVPGVYVKVAHYLDWIKQTTQTF